MPWTRKQVKYLLSKASPLGSGQKAKMVGELHANPSMGHMKKGYSKVESKGKMSPIRSARGKANY